MDNRCVLAPNYLYMMHVFSLQIISGQLNVFNEQQRSALEVGS